MLKVEAFSLLVSARWLREFFAFAAPSFGCQEGRFVAKNGNSKENVKAREASAQPRNSEGLRYVDESLRVCFCAYSASTVMHEVNHRIGHAADLASRR